MNKFHIPKTHQETRESINRHIKDYLASGGSIKHLEGMRVETKAYKPVRANDGY